MAIQFRAVLGGGAAGVNGGPTATESARMVSLMLTCDFLVIGSGIAGLSFALEAATHGEVIVVTKRSREESNTKYAQGGVAAVLDKNDSFDAHVNDTLVAGAGMNHRRAVELCVREAPDRIRMLRDLGTRFDTADGDP